MSHIPVIRSFLFLCLPLIVFSADCAPVFFILVFPHGTLHSLAFGSIIKRPFAYFDFLTILLFGLLSSDTRYVSVLFWVLILLFQWVYFRLVHNQEILGGHFNFVAIPLVIFRKCCQKKKCYPEQCSYIHNVRTDGLSDVVWRGMGQITTQMQIMTCHFIYLIIRIKGIKSNIGIRTSIISNILVPVNGG